MYSKFLFVTCEQVNAYPVQCSLDYYPELAPGMIEIGGGASNFTQVTKVTTS